MIILLLFIQVNSLITEISLLGIGLKEQLLQQIDENQLDCGTIQLIITRGFGQIILDLIQDDQIYLEQHLQCAKQSIQNDLLQLDNLRKKLQQQNEIIHIKPILLWAQSRTNLLIKIKFAHRIDAPAYISIKNHQVSIQNELLQIKAESDQNNQYTQFLLEIPLLYNVQKNINWQIESVGTMVLNITKIENKLWLHLSKNKKDKFQIWWDIKQQIGQDMDDFSKLIDNQDTKKTKIKTIKQEIQQITWFQRIKQWIRSLFY